MAKRQMIVPTKLLPESMLRDFPFFHKMDASDQRDFLEKGQSLGQAIYQGKAARLQVGKYLIELQVLLKHNFRTFIKELNYAEKTVYRIMDDYRETQNLLPIQAQPYAMAMNKDVAQKKYRPAIKKYVADNPLPESGGAETMQPWLDGLEHHLRQYDKARMGGKSGTVEVLPPEDPEDLLEESFRFAKIRFHRLPNSRNRMKWLERLFGYMLKEAGVGSSMSFAPMTAPDAFLTGRGRPKLDS